MTREHKLALIVGFALVLAVAILISDHFSGASRAEGSGIVAENTPTGLLGPGGRDIAFDLPGTQEFAQQPRIELAPETPLSIDQQNDRLASIDAQSGSVLESLANSVNSAINDLRNGHTPPAALQTDTLRMGQPVNPVTAVTPERTSDLARGIDPRDIKRHNVAAGESLWGIAAAHYGDGHLYKQLAEFNAGRVGEGGAVHPGVTILLPPKNILLGNNVTQATSTVETPRNTPASTPVKTGTKSSARTYTVKKGDTLGLISQRELGTVKRMQEIIDLNRDQIDNADEITVGMTLKLPARS